MCTAVDFIGRNVALDRTKASSRDGRLSRFAGLVLAGCCVSIFSSHVLAADPPGNSVPPEEPAAFKRVLASWRARKERFRTLHLQLSTRLASPKLQRFNAHIEVWADRQKRYRIVSKTDADGETRCRAFDGVTSHELTTRDNSSVGQFRKGDDRREVGTWLLAVLPLAGIGGDRGELRFMTENAILDGKHFVKLQRLGRETVDTFWIDPARDDLVGYWERQFQNGQRTAISIDYRRDAKYGWLPTAWHETQKFPAWNRTISVTKLAIDEDLPDAFFQPAFPPGAIVFDEIRVEKYVAAKDGSKLNRLPFDSPASMRIDEILEQTADFTIEPEPLKDAIDFIQQRYQIAVAIGRVPLRGLQTEVKAQTAGIKVRRLLETLLEQSKVPLNYEVQKGVLAIEAAAVPK